MTRPVLPNVSLFLSIISVFVTPSHRHTFCISLCLLPFSLCPLSRSGKAMISRSRINALCPTQVSGTLRHLSADTLDMTSRQPLTIRSFVRTVKHNTDGRRQEIRVFLKWAIPWRTLVEGGKERYRPPGKLTLELVHANQNKLLCLWTMQLTKWAGKVPYLLLLKCSMDKCFIHWSAFR